MSEYTVSGLNEQNIGGVCEIEKEAFRYPWSRDDFNKELNNKFARYAVLMKNGAVAAYGGFWLSGDEAYINNIAVKKSERRRGLGSLVVTELLNAAKNAGARAITLEVRVSNTAAIALYEKFGFVNEGVRPKFYPDGEDAYIMWRYSV